MGDVFLQERQDTVIDSDTIVLILVSAAAFIGQLISVFIGICQDIYLPLGFTTTSMKSVLS